MKRWILSFLLAAAFLSGCAGSDIKTSADEPQVKPQTVSSQENQQSADENTNEGQNSTSETVSRLADELREQEAVNRENKEVINIEEKIYLSQMTDVYMNTGDYIGRTISMEGYMIPYDVGDDIIGAVVRSSPGCCGDDGITGLSFIWDGDVPADNDWISVSGVLSMRVEGQEIYLVIEADNVEVKEERGLEFVSQ